jgi:hypothetical protein
MSERSLDQTVETETQIKLWNMFQTSPRWLTIPRLKQASLTVRRFEAMLASDKTMKDAMTRGELDIRKIIGNVQNEPLPPTFKNDLPRSLRDQLDIDEPPGGFDTQKIILPNGPPVIVTDLSAGCKYNGSLPSEKTYAELITLFLASIQTPDPDQLPPLLNRGILRPIRYFLPGYVAGVRIKRDHLILGVEPPSHGLPGGEHLAHYQLFGACGGTNDLDDFLRQTGLFYLPSRP